MKKAVCLLSGGPDSAAAAAVARRESYDVYCLSFDYGQIASKEIESAKKVAKAIGVKKHKIIDISFLKDLYGPGVTALTDRKMSMPEKFEPSVIVPFRNGILLAIAAGYAASIGAEAIFYGPQQGDAGFYPDCRQEFVDAMSQAIKRGTDLKIEVKNPLGKKPKSEVLKLAIRLGVPLELTWSCYLNGKFHCGQCESCKNRIRAFKDAGIKDPTRYGSRIR
jgi:7-cyano-7-deazaguanine synthase